MMTIFIETTRVDSQPERLVSLRIKGDMKIREIFPILRRTPPRERPGHRMAVGARALHAVVGDVGLVLNSMLGVIHDRLRLFGRQAVIGREVFENGSGLVRSQ